MYIVEALESNVLRHPLKEALLFQNRQYTYEAFNKAVNKLANGLVENGVDKGDKVVLMMKNSDYFAITYFALAKIGAVIVPMNFRLLSKEIAYIVHNSDSKHIITDVEFEQEIVKIIGSDLEIENLISVPNSMHAAFKSYNQILSEDDSNPDIEILGTDDLAILYTSGTTGHPKGAVFDHERIKQLMYQFIISLNYHPNERFLHFAPLFHSAQLNICLLPQIYIGGFGVIYDNFDPKTILHDIGRYQITSMLAVPTMYNAFLQVPKENDFDFSSINKFMYGAAPMSQNVVRKCIEYFGSNNFYSLCGQTETGPAGIILYPNDHEKHAGMSGKDSTMFTQVDIVTPSGKSVKVGEIGEIIVKAPSNMKEYYKNPEATHKTMKDGWIYSGDLAVRDEDGYILLVDRNKDMIISGGENVYSIEVENVIATHHSVAEVAIIGTPDPKWGEVVTAIIVTKRDEDLTEKEIIEFAKENIAGYKCPKKVIFEDKLPRNASGKLLKYQLRQKYNVIEI
ncbi:long-chain-fatty-acid--CoA ligase [Rummeliibacillus pycnus]|uniref:long-chain-fatty-acid--CoA ligase n=1 Tax=Rummeliibacillus pycnus TaxID=101070 RepID=UPI003D2AAE42